MSDLQTINAATHNLHQLLAIIYETVADIPCQDSEHKHALIRACALAILARDEAQRIDTAIDELVDAGIAESRDDAAVVTTLGDEYEEYHAAWNAAGGEYDKAPKASKKLKAEEERLEALHDSYRDQLFAYRPTTPAGFAAKAKVFLRIWDHAEGMNDNRIVQFFESMGGR